MIRPSSRTCLFHAFVALLAVGCGPDGIQGGIDGTGIHSGDVVSYGRSRSAGSVEVNGLRYHTAGTTFLIDGVAGNQADVQPGDIVIVEGTIDPVTDRAAAHRVIVDHVLQGTVDALDAPGGSIVSLGQTVVVDPETQFDALIDDGLAGLRLGEAVSVSGFRDVHGVIVATRIDRQAGGAPVFRTTGAVTNIAAADKRLSINDLEVDYSAVQLPADAVSQLAAGVFVEVKGRIRQATGVFAASGLELPRQRAPGAVDSRVEIEGYITSQVGSGSPTFQVDGLPVRTTAATYFSGTVSDDKRVAIVGSVNAGGTVVASTFNGTNRAPVAADMSLTTPFETTVSGWLPAATDPDNDAVTYGVSQWAAHGWAQISTDGRFTYQPNGAYSGTDSFNYRVMDGRGGQSTYTVSVTVTPSPWPAPACVNLSAAPAPSGQKKVAFTSGRDGNFEIYSVNDDGTGLARLTNALSRDEEPVWSPDGRRIAFVSDRTGVPQIYVMNADGSHIVRRTYTEHTAMNPTWSPDGTRIAYSTLSDGSADIWVVGADCEFLPRLLFHAPGYDAQPAWSPDGSRIALASDWMAYDFVYDIYLINADGTNPVWLTGNIFDSTDYVMPSWSPDGSRIAMAVTENMGLGPLVTRLGIMNADGTGLTPLIPAADWTKSSWSPDGTRIAFTSSSGAARSVSWVAAEGSASGTIVTDGWDPSWQR